jgi:hypothetical protein
MAASLPPLPPPLIQPQLRVPAAAHVPAPPPLYAPSCPPQVNEMCERLAYYGIATNIITYLTGKLGQSNSSSAAAVNAWSGTCKLSCLVAACILPPPALPGWTASGLVDRALTKLPHACAYRLRDPTAGCFHCGRVSAQAEGHFLWAALRRQHGSAWPGRRALHCLHALAPPPS